MLKCRERSAWVEWLYKRDTHFILISNLKIWTDSHEQLCWTYKCVLNRTYFQHFFVPALIFSSAIIKNKLIFWCALCLTHIGSWYARACLNWLFTSENKKKMFTISHYNIPVAHPLLLVSERFFTVQLKLCFIWAPDGASIAFELWSWILGVLCNLFFEKPIKNWRIHSSSHNLCVRLPCVR